MLLIERKMYSDPNLKYECVARSLYQKKVNCQF